MLVDFDNKPQNSIIYTTSIILSYLKNVKTSILLEDVYIYCLDRNMEYSMFFLSIDWLFLLGVIQEINEKGELILCD